MPESIARETDGPGTLQADRDGLYFLLREMADRAQGELVHDLMLDEANSTLNFRRDGCRIGSRRLIPLEAADLARMQRMKGRGDARITLRSCSDGTAQELYLADEQSPGRWGRALLLGRSDAVQHGCGERGEKDVRAALTIAHELRQPLFTISIATERLRMLSARMVQHGREVRCSASRIAAQVDRAQTIISRTLGHRETPESCGYGMPTDAVQAARNAVDYLDAMVSAAEVSVRVRCGDGPAYVNLDGVALEQVFVNVIRNGLEAIQSRREQGWSGAGRISVEIATMGGIAHATVTDNGSGMAGATTRGFSECARPASSKRGFGLGLSICREILTPVGGVVELKPGRERGMVVEIKLPLRNNPKASDIVPA